MRLAGNNKGQALSELVLISGLVALVGLGALTLMAGSLSKQLGTMWSYFGVGSQQASANVAGPVSSNTSTVPKPSANGNVTPLSNSLTPAQLSANANLNALYASLQNGSADLVEVSGGYGNLAQNNLALAAQLQQLAASTATSNPEQSAALGDLAKQVKVLAGWQMSTQFEAEHIIIGSWDTSILNKIQSIAIETGTYINGFDGSGSGSSPSFQPPDSQASDGDWGAEEAAQSAQSQAQTVAAQWSQLQQQGTLNALDTASQALVNTAATSVLATSDIYTTQNAQGTYNHGQTIQNVSKQP